MADLLGNLITIPDITISGVFPLVPDDYQIMRSIGYEYVIHPFSLKKEQRILKRKRGNIFKVGRTYAQETEVEALYTFYDAHRSPNQCFYFYDPAEHIYPYDLTGASTTGRYAVRFSDGSLNFQAMMDSIHTGELELCEVNTSTTPISVGGLFETFQHRFPEALFNTTGGLTTFLKGSVVDADEFIHLLFITPRDYDVSIANFIRVADRRVQYDQTDISPNKGLSGLYLPRLLAWDVGQERGEEDSAHFVFDNADGVFTEYINQRTLHRAEVEFFIHAKLNDYPLHLWRGYISDYHTDEKDGTFVIDCDSLHQFLRLPLPERTVNATCRNRFNDDASTVGSSPGSCPWSRVAEATGNPSSCDKTWDGANGCTSHTMNRYFQGVHIKPMKVTGKLNNTGFLGLFKKGYSSTSHALETVYGKTIPLIYGLGRQVVEADIFEVRDESEFLVASGIIGEGTIKEVGQVLLDGQTQHTGFDPIIFKGGSDHPLAAPGFFQAQDFIGIGPIALQGTIIDPDFRSARLAYASVRRSDEVGIQDKDTRNHQMLVEVLSGVPGIRLHWSSSVHVQQTEVESSNPCTIILDMFLRAMNERYPLFIELKNFFIEVSSWIATAQPFCDEVVNNMSGDGTEARWAFRGVLKEQRPALDWIRDIANTAAVDVVWSVGKLKLKPRKDDITIAPAGQIIWEEEENIIDQSFSAGRYQPKFNDLSLTFSDEDYDFRNRDVRVYDEQAQIKLGNYYWRTTIQERKYQIKESRTLPGVYGASQVLRLAIQLLREELGGATSDEQDKARTVKMSAGLLGLAVEIGDISKVIHSALPDGQAFVRWDRWRYSSEYRVDLEGKTVVPSMFNPYTTTQAPPAITGVPVAGIPGGSQGSDGTENEPTALTAPTLTLIGIPFRDASIEVSAKPPVTNYLVTQVSDTIGFGTPTEAIKNTPIALFTISGTPGTTKYVRAKWRRSTVPLEEGAWSATLTVVFADVALNQKGSLTLSFRGVQAVASSVASIRCPFNGTFVRWFMDINGPDSTGATILQARKQNVPIFTAGTRPTVNAPGISSNGIVFNLTTFLEDEIIELDVDQIGTTGPRRFNLQFQVTRTA